MQNEHSKLSILNNGEQWAYRVKLYLIGHSQLQIEAVSQSGHKVYINCIGVEFYDGPFNWSGKTFSTGDPKECSQLLKRDMHIDMHDDSEFQLYIAVSDSNYPVRIIAAVLSVTEKNLYSNYVP